MNLSELARKIMLEKGGKVSLPTRKVERERIRQEFGLGVVVDGVGHLSVYTSENPYGLPTGLGGAFYRRPVTHLWLDAGTAEDLARAEILLAGALKLVREILEREKQRSVARYRVKTAGKARRM